MDAIVTAGGIPKPEEPLYEYTQGKSKATLDVAGKTMIQWVIDALEGAKSIDKIVVIGLPEDVKVTSRKIATYVPSQGGILENIKYGVEKMLEFDPNARQVLAVSSDIPAITSEIVDWTVKAIGDDYVDICYNVITRQVMQSRFPKAERSYIKLKDMEVCGGDMNVVGTQTVLGNEELWGRIVNARKSVFKQAALIGYDTLLLLMLRRITLDDAVKMVVKRLGVTGKAIVCPYAEVGMDIDKPHQLEILRNDLALTEA